MISTLTKDQEARILEDVRAKFLTQSEIGLKYGISQSQVSKIWRKTNPPMTKRITPQLAERVRALYYEQGSSQKCIANTVEISQASVSAILRKTYRAPKYSKEMRDRVQRLLSDGTSIYSVSRMLNIPPTTITYMRHSL